MEDIEKIKQCIRNLIIKYEHVKNTGKYVSMPEMDVAANFVEPLFKALEWNTTNPDEYDRERRTPEGGRIDAVMKKDGEDAILIEYKRFNEIHSRSSNSLTYEPPYPEEKQLLDYVRDHGKGIKYVILTNFEKFRLFNTFNNKIVLNIEHPSQYLDENFKIFIGLQKPLFPKYLETGLEKGDWNPTETLKPKTELDKLLKTIDDSGYNEDEKQQILQILNWAYITKGSHGYYCRQFNYKHVTTTDPHPISEKCKNFLTGQNLVRFSVSSTSIPHGGRHSDVFTHIDITEKGLPIGSQLVIRLIKKNETDIINIINSIPCKALKVILEYPQTSRFVEYSQSRSYPASRPTKTTPYPPYRIESLSSHIGNSFFSDIGFYPNYDLISKINNIIESYIYDIFTHFEKSWEIGDTFFSRIYKMLLGERTNSSGTEIYVIPEELRGFVLAHLKCELDDEIKKILLASILAGIYKRSYDIKHIELIYIIIKETATESEIKAFINNMASSGINTNYIYQPGSSPFIVHDSQKYFEYIDSNIINPVIESIIKNKQVSETT